MGQAFRFILGAVALLAQTVLADAECVRRSSWPGGAVFDCWARTSPDKANTVGWALSFSLDARITQAWNVAIEQGSGPRHRLNNLDYNGSLLQPQSFGFVIDSESALPTDLVLELRLPPPAPTIPPPSPTLPPAPTTTPPPLPTASPTPPPSGDIALPRPGYLAARGAELVDSRGAVVRLTGVSWFGLETETRAPHGLWARGYKQILASAREAGFNFLRVPYSNDIFKPELQPNGIDFTKNPDLKGLSALQILDKIIAEAGRLGMRVLLDRHRPDGKGQSDLWYTAAVPEATWIADWVKLARRYRNNPTVIGADLHNEPHGRATWGVGGAATDWRLAAERAGNAILRENPDWLIVVEGVERVGDDWYWWGGNLRGARTAPVRLDVPGRLVYSPHDYPASVHEQSWFSDASFPLNLPGVWGPRWGYLVDTRTAPVLIGELGTKLATTRDAQWLATLVDYIVSRGLSFAFWSLNPNSGDTGGILENDWITLDRRKLDTLKPALAPALRR